MIEVKTSELIGPALDWMVSRTTNETRVSIWGKSLWIEDGNHAGHGSSGQAYNPSVNAGQGWPIIADIGRRISLELRIDENSASYLNGGIRTGYTAITVLVASMRAIVAAHFGDTVIVPAELIESLPNKDADQ